MNDIKPWRRKEETEINLIASFKPLIRQWKQMLLCAVILACLLCAYKFQQDSIPMQEIENTTPGEESIKMTDDQQRQVNTAVILRKKVETAQTYLNESILMQLDPSHVCQATLLYSIDDANKDKKQKIIQSYMSFVNDGAALEALVKADSQWANQQEYLVELFSATLADSNPQWILTEQDIQEPTLFYVKISAENSSMAEKIIATLQEAIDDYHTSVNKIAGHHSLNLLSNQQMVKADRDIREKQQNSITQLSTNQMNLNNLITGFDENQKNAYEQMFSKKTEQNTSKNFENAKVKSNINVKWLLLGFVGGIFVYCLVFVCWYLLRDTVKNTDELRENYVFPVYGGIHLYKGKKGNGEDLSIVQKDGFEREKAQMLNRIRLSCQQQEITEICLATDFSLSEQEKEFMAVVSKQLSEWKIKTVLVENITGNISMWDAMTSIGKLLLVCRINKTTHRMIDEEMAFFNENHLEVLGAVTLEH